MQFLKISDCNDIIAASGECFYVCGIDFMSGDENSNIEELQSFNVNKVNGIMHCSDIHIPVLNILSCGRDKYVKGTQSHKNLEMKSHILKTPTLAPKDVNKIRRRNPAKWNELQKNLKIHKEDTGSQKKECMQKEEYTKAEHEEVIDYDALRNLNIVVDEYTRIVYIFVMLTEDVDDALTQLRNMFTKVEYLVLRGKNGSFSNFLKIHESASNVILLPEIDCSISNAGSFYGNIDKTQKQSKFKIF